MKTAWKPCRAAFKMSFHRFKNHSIFLKFLWFMENLPESSESSKLYILHCIIMASFLSTVFGLQYVAGALPHHHFPITLVHVPVYKFYLTPLLSLQIWPLWRITDILLSYSDLNILHNLANSPLTFYIPLISIAWSYPLGHH